jgi:hypothetical protein
MTGRSLFVLLLFLAAVPASAQLTGKVDDPAWGISFTVPDGWLARKIDAGYLVGSETQPGFILLTSHQYRTMQELRSESSRGVQDQNGTDLAVAGSAAAFGGNGLKVEYAGMLEGTAARAVAIALLAPQGGGVTVLVGVQESSFGPAYARLAESVARSVSFKKPSTGAIAEQWRKRLSGSKLTYLSSYTSGSSGGYSAQTVIHLCPAGTFSMESSSSVSVDVPGASGSSSGQDGGRGIWTVVTQAGNPVLELRFENGSAKHYALTAPQNTLHLNGTRYFQTNDPDCP